MPVLVCCTSLMETTKETLQGKLILSIKVIHNNALVPSLAAANFTSHPIAQTWAPLIIWFQISEETSM